MEPDTLIKEEDVSDMTTHNCQGVLTTEVDQYLHIMLADFARVQNPNNVSHRSWTSMKWQVETLFEADMAFEIASR